MLKRILSSLVGLIILVVILIAQKQTLYFATAIIGVIGLKEFYDAMKQKSNPISSIGLLFGGLYIFLIEKLNLYENNFVLLLLCMFLTLFVIIIIRHKEHNIIDVSITITGFFYVCVLLAYVPLVKNLVHGDIYVWLIFLVAWGSDTGAYLTGKTLGKTKIFPHLSPKKTWAGAIGGIIFSCIFVTIYMTLLSKYNILNIKNYQMIGVLIGIFGSVISQLGDLVASVIKRYCGIKDYGDIIPGHGGILDRFDSIIFVAPFVYYIIVEML